MKVRYDYSIHVFISESGNIIVKGDEIDFSELLDEFLDSLTIEGTIDRENYQIALRALDSMREKIDGKISEISKMTVVE